MKRPFRLGVVLVLFLVVICVVYVAMQTNDGRISTLPDYDNWRNADILLLGSSTWRGRLLKLLDTRSDYLHVGIIDKSNGECHLIHADPKHGCVVRERLDEYFASNKVERALLLRVQSDEKCADAAIAFAREQSIVAREFDNAFRYGEGNGLYCTELVLQAWSAANAKLLPEVRTGDRILPSQLLESNLVRPIVDCQGDKIIVLSTSDGSSVKDNDLHTR